MADITLSGAATAGFIPQVWAARALEILRANIVLTRLVTRDTEWAPGWKGQTLNIPYPGTFTAQDKAANTPATVQAPTGNTVPITLNKHKYVDFIVEDVAAAQANSNLMDRYTSPAVIALAEQLETDIFALYTGLTGTVGTSGTDVTAAAIRSTMTALTNAKVPQAGRNLVLSPKDVAALMADATLQNYFAFARPEVIEGGGNRLARMYGFDIYQSQLVPVVAGSPNSTKNLAFVSEAIMLAIRPFEPPPPGSGVDVAQMQDPESGLTIRVLHQYDMANRGVRVGFDILYGAAVLSPIRGTVVLS
jgi:hypothetical protein